MRRYLALAMVLVLVTLTAGCSPQKSEKPAQPAQQPQAQPEKVLSFTIDCENTEKEVSEAIAQQLKNVGIEAQVRVWGDWSVLKKALLAGEREAHFTYWGNSTLDPFDILNPKYLADGTSNYSRYINQELIECINKGATELTSEGRIAAYKKAQEIIARDIPVIYAYAPKNIEACAQTVKNWRPSTDDRMNLHDVEVEGADTITAAIRESIPTLDPADHRSRVSETVIRNIFDGLVTRTPDGKVVPEIAESWTNPSPTVWEFTLRKGVTFHDGSPLTSEDVKFTFERILNDGGMGNGKTSPRKSMLGPLQTVEAPDKYTVRFTLKEPWPILPQMFVHQQIVPKAYVSKVGSKTFAEKPVGAGPFKLISCKGDERVVLERYSDYYGGAPDITPVGPAKLKRVIFEIMPEVSTRVAALEAGKAHIIQAVPPSLVKNLESNPKVSVKYANGTNAYMMNLNVSKPPFNDLKVRQAVAHAIDWDTIISKLLGGNAVRMPGPLLPHGFACDPSIKGLPYDVAKAKALLNEAGYKAAQ
ncbi:MAG: ABC transporter substrate-binding protein [Ignavibacteriales bacterium]